MRTKEGLKLRTICGENVVVGEGLAQVNVNKLISLNDSAAWLWVQLQGREFSEEDICTLLQERYDVSAEQALEDSRKLAATWIDQGIVEP